MELHWWIGAIEIPALGGLFWLLQSYRAASDKSIVVVRDDLANYKLIVATSFASVSYLKDVEGRIMAHLEKIEKKIDRVIEQRHPPAE